ncbi:MAG TPA: phosphate/phosphite/phosphonate ABC transporter substrate-binding protein [Myxococcaceae bacterium]|nr:phosphate/phosphite/phosphonate ABC transporter substrate-binding protein [Myxococcaceae bacterium]
MTAPRSAFRLGLPSSLPVAPAPGAASRLTRVLSGIVGRQVSVVVFPEYDGLTEAIRRGEVDAAWAPPLVAARAEALGARVMVRPLRRGSVRSRSALLVRSDSSLQLETLGGSTAAWVDRTSLAGHLLPLAWLRERGLEPGRLFGQQLFLGSYQACIQALLGGEADVAALFAPPEGHDLRLAVEEVAPGRGPDVRVLACTMPALHDAWLVAPHVPLSESLRIERGLLSIRELPEGTVLLRDVVRAERLERAPELGHRELFARGLSDVTLPLRAEVSA